MPKFRGQVLTLTTVLPSNAKYRLSSLLLFSTHLVMIWELVECIGEHIQAVPSWRGRATIAFLPRRILIYLGFVVCTLHVSNFSFLEYMSYRGVVCTSGRRAMHGYRHVDIDCILRGAYLIYNFLHFRELRK